SSAVVHCGAIRYMSAFASCFTNRVQGFSERAPSAAVPSLRPALRRVSFNDDHQSTPPRQDRVMTRTSKLSRLSVAAIGAASLAAIGVASLHAQGTAAPPVARRPEPSRSQTPVQLASTNSATSDKDAVALKGLKWRSVGPANNAGRISVITGVPGDPYP